MMQRFRYEWITAGDVQAANRLLTEGWRPVREVIPGPLPAGAEAGPAARGEVLIVLEREDDVPAYRGETIADGIPLETLDGVGLLEGLKAEELREFVAACQWGRYDAEEVVFDEGQEEQRLYVVIDGSVSIHLHGLPIDDPVILEAGPLDTFGESTFYSPAAHSTRAVASSPLRTLELSRDRYDELLQAQRPVAFRIGINSARLLGRRLQATDDWIRQILQEGNTAEVIHSWRRFRRGFTHGEAGIGFVHI